MKLDDIKKLIDAATAGPWIHEAAAGTPHLIHADPEKDFFERFVVINDDEADSANMTFIAASRTLMPKLLKVAEAVRANMLERCMVATSASEYHKTFTEMAMDDALAALEAD